MKTRTPHGKTPLPKGKPFHQTCRAPAGCGGYSSSTVGFHGLATRLPAYPSAQGLGAKRGELRGAARAGQGRASGAGGGDSNGSCSSPPPREARSLLYENRCPAMDSCGVMGMFWGLSAGARTARSLWGWTVDKEIYIYICPLLPRRARGVCTLWI